ncbi:MAG: tetratricopeptide repeat protein [Bacilli bacterium]
MDQVMFKQLFKRASQGDAESQYEVGQCYLKGEGTEANEWLAYQWTLKSAEQGYIEAQFLVGVMLANGTGAEVNAKEAVLWFRRAAFRGHSDAQYSLGWLYESGTGVEQNHEEAFRWYLQGANNGNAHAMSALGLLYEQGVGTEVNLTEATRWYETASEQNQPNAIYRLGLLREDAEDPNWLTYVERAADLGSPAAQVHLGWLYQYGDVVPHDYQKAFQFYYEAATNGNMLGQFYLGICYAEGMLADELTDELEVKVDYEKAVFWFFQAANEGHPPSCLKLALHLMEGKGIEKDEPAAFHWMNQAAKEQYEPAMFNLGLFYERGVGVERNPTKAFQWFERAAEAGDIDAQVVLYQYLEADFPFLKDEEKKRFLDWRKSHLPGSDQSDIVPLFPSNRDSFQTNATEKLKWLRKAAEGEHPRAQYMLGLAYFNGDIVEQSDELAAMWFQKGVQGGDDLAMNHLAYLYETGRGVEQNGEVAIRLYEQAAALGNIQSVRNLGIAYEEGIGVPQDKQKALYYYSCALDAGYVEAAARVARMLIDSGDPDEAWRGVKILHDAIEQQDLESKVLLASIYVRGHVLEANPIKAERLFLEVVSETPHPYALFSLGYLYETGGAGVKDSTKAVHFYEQAMEQGYPSAHYYLAEMYESGRDIPKDDARAFEIYLQGAELGDAQCMVEVAMCYEVGQGTSIDGREAIRWYESAIGEEVPSAYYALGRVYYYGELISEDLEYAYELFLRAHELGSTESAVFLGWYAENGTPPVKRNLLQARTWYELSALSGDEEGKIALRRVEQHIEQQMKRQNRSSGRKH